MPVSRLLNYLLRSFLVLLISAPFILLILALQGDRLAAPNLPLTTAEINEVEQLLLDSAPQSTATTSSQRVEIGPRQINLLQRYGFQVMGLLPQWSGNLELQQDQVMAQLSIEIGLGSFSLFLNLQGSLRRDTDEVILQNLRLGNLQLPRPIMNYAVARLESNLLSANVGFDDFLELLTKVDILELSADKIAMNVVWEPQLMDSLANRAQQIFVPQQDRERILDYYQVTKDIVSTIPIDLRAVSLNTFLIAIFNEAQERSAVSSDPIAENRAALQALAIYVNNENIAQLVGEEMAADVEPASFIEVRLQRRQDLAQHLVSIAAITASAGAGFAQMLSNTKEAYDARYRSGFSFSDLTANTVGVTLATYATQNRTSAETMQRRIVSMSGESDFMPEVGNNRDGISEADFTLLYQDRNSDEYELRLAQIQSLIESLQLFQGLPPITDSQF